MLPSILNRLTYANVASTVCLFIVLGGSAYATVSISGRDVRNGSLTSADVKDHSLRGRDFKRGALRRGPQGPPGPQGAPGRDGAPAPVVTYSEEPIGRLSLPGVTGDGPGGAITVRGIAWSNTLAGDPFAGGQGGSAKPGWGAVTLSKAADRSSGQLWRLTASGRHMAAAKLELLAPGASAPYARYELEDVAVTAFSTRGSGHERRDELALSFDAAVSPAFSFDGPVAVRRSSVRSS
jgi:type VI protein secretion system component Hcp